MRTMLRRLGAFSLLSVSVAAYAAPEGVRLSADDWKQAAASDIEAAYQITLENHPGVFDPANPAFAANLSKARDGGLALAAQVRDGAGYVAAIQRFNTLIHDGHAGVITKDVPTPPARWPGFVTAWRGDSMFVSATTVGGPPVGARVEACDGKPIKQVVEKNVFAFNQRAEERGHWWVYARDVFVDRGNPFVTVPAQCTLLVDGAKLPLSLKWREMDDAARQLRDDGYNGITLPVGLTQPRPNLYWFAMPTFQPNAAERTVYNAMIRDLQLNRQRYLNADALVIDLRDNQGGSSTWSLDFAQALWGEARVDRRIKVAEAKQEVWWRASFANIAHTSFLVNTLAEQGQRTFADEAKIISQGMMSAQARDEKFYVERQKSAAVTDNERAADLPGDPPPFTRPVYVIVPGQCASACLDALDVFTMFSNTKLVGAPSAADSTYMEVRLEPLKSELATVIVPTKMYVNRPRPAGKVYTPAIYVEDLEWSPQTFQKVIEADLTKR